MTRKEYAKKVTSIIKTLVEDYEQVPLAKLLSMASHYKDFERQSDEEFLQGLENLFHILPNPINDVEIFEHDYLEDIDDDIFFDEDMF